jgi:hypothetical protein
MPLNSDVAVTNLHSVEVWNIGDEYIFKMRPIFQKIIEIGRDRTEFKNHWILEFKFKNFKKIKNGNIM